MVSDSGTLPEESSLCLSSGHPIPAVCIRTSTERPEALGKGCFVPSGIDEAGLLQSVDLAVEMVRNGDLGVPVPDYVDENVSVGGPSARALGTEAFHRRRRTALRVRQGVRRGLRLHNAGPELPGTRAGHLFGGSGAAGDQGEGHAAQGGTSWATGCRRIGQSRPIGIGDYLPTNKG